MAEREHLVRMANQIAANFRFHEDAANRVADHLRRFWAPSMKHQLLAFSASNPAELDPLVREAVRQLEA